MSERFLHNKTVPLIRDLRFDVQNTKTVAKPGEAYAGEDIIRMLNMIDDRLAAIEMAASGESMASHALGIVDEREVERVRAELIREFASDGD